MKYKVGKLYWKPVVLALILDIVITLGIGIILGILYAVLGGDIEVLDQPNLMMDILTIIVGVGSTAFATMWMLKRVPENKLHNVSLFVLISIGSALPAIFFMEPYMGTVMGVISTILWIITPYVVWNYIRKQSS